MVLKVKNNKTIELPTPLNSEWVKVENQRGLIIITPLANKFLYSLKEINFDVVRVRKFYDKTFIDLPFYVPDRLYAYFDGEKIYLSQKPIKEVKDGEEAEVADRVSTEASGTGEEASGTETRRS